jgi:hypothetical protein
VHDHTALVVGRAAAKEPTILLGRLERLGVPQLSRAGGLHIVVRVEQNGRRARGRLHAPEHRGRRALDLQKARLGAGIAKDLRGRVRGATEL